MSPPRSGADDRIILGDQIVEHLRAQRLPTEPHQFEFWFAYKSGRNAALNAAAEEIRLRSGALTGADIDHLHGTFLSPWRHAEKPDATSAKLINRLGDIAVTLDGAIGTAKAQRDTLATEADALGGNGLSMQELLLAIDRLTQATKETQARFGALEARMDAASREIGMLRQQLSAVRNECRTDPTTGLPSRATFNETLPKVLESAAESRQPIAVILCNLDHFTAFNETFGNVVGDKVLRSIGMLMKARMRAADIVARFGGDEFAVIAPQMRASDAVMAAENFRQMLMAHQLTGHPNGAGRITASIGVADAIKGDNAEFLLRRAANGLTIAKREGRNRVVEMTPDGPVWEPQPRG